ncbi:hypothetical protein SGFS_050870 [Streptomyces graminofaciens]|uniref:Integral membrane protein n=1 Tax=Streptomyces graminofaciens TaxID=68212 RepID=A0ABM8HL27_9ACTN|nr:hypothetical protein [Streptomyces graminofaciens]BBC33793.1 hypothetical protein SGFS_050870 [Streptomyces graminofaciens]
MPATTAAHAKRAKRAPRVARPGVSGALRYGRLGVMGAVALVILVAGVWGSWGGAQHLLLSKGREQGTMKVTRCDGETCWGPYEPASKGYEPRARVDIENSAAVRTGETYTVVVKPGSREVVRTGPAGMLHAWVPMGGALMLASVIVAGGLRMSRSAWVLGGAGIALITAAWVAL